MLRSFAHFSQSLRPNITCHRFTYSFLERTRFTDTSTLRPYLTPLRIGEASLLHSHSPLLHITTQSPSFCFATSFTFTTISQKKKLTIHSKKNPKKKNPKKKKKGGVFSTVAFDVPSRDSVTHTHGYSVKGLYFLFASNCNFNR